MSFTSADLQFYRVMDRAISERLDEIRDALASGHCQSFDDYRHRVGQIKALKDMQLWAAEVNREAQGLPKRED